MNEEHQMMAVNAIAHAAEMINVSIQSAVSRYESPSAIWRPRLYIDGNQWCALYGDDLQEGVAGFGDSPAAAMWDFDKAWGTRLSLQKGETE